MNLKISTIIVSCLAILFVGAIILSVYFYDEQIEDRQNYEKQISEQDWFMVVYYPYKGSLEEFYKTEKDTFFKLLKDNEIKFTKIVGYKIDSNFLTIYIFDK